MLEIASQMILCLLLAALIGAIIGYILGKSTCADDDCTQTEESTHSNSHATILSLASVTPDSLVADTKDEGQTPQLLSQPRNGEKDNLTRIKGVGMKIEESLNQIGVYHFDQIAGWTAGNIIWADNSLGFPGRADRESWVEQAKLLAAGRETEFSKRVDAGEVASSKKS